MSGRGTGWLRFGSVPVLVAYGIAIAPAAALGGASPIDFWPIEIATSAGAPPYASVLDTGELVVVWAEGTSLWSQILSSGPAAPDPADRSVVLGATEPIDAPVVAPLAGRGFVVAWIEGSAFAPVRFGASPGAALPPEAMLLQERLDLGAELDVSIVPSADGVWFLWSGYDGFTPMRGLSAFHLPLD